MRLLHMFIFVAGTAAALAFIPQAANADKVCNKVCSEGVCEEKCVETQGRGTEGRSDRREDRREERREDRRDSAPGIKLRVPGVGIDLGR